MTSLNCMRKAGMIRSFNGDTGPYPPLGTGFGFASPEEAYAYARSPEYFAALHSLVRMEETSALNLIHKFNWAMAHPRYLPQLFGGNLLRIPETLPPLLPREHFPRSVSGPRFVLLAAKAHFDESHVGTYKAGQKIYRQVFFTDPDTARFLRGRRSSIARKFPESYVDSRTEVLTGVSMVQAARASVSDPYFVNPARIGNDFFFTGAIDLFPIETAQDLADEVMVTYPSLSYGTYEITAMQSAFGFDPSQAALMASRQTGLTWIAPDGANLVNFDPRPWGITMVNSLPGTHAEFSARVSEQYRRAFHEGRRAAQVHIKEHGNGLHRRKSAAFSP